MDFLALVVVGLESASEGRGRIFAFRRLMCADNRDQGWQDPVATCSTGAGFRNEMPEADLIAICRWLLRDGLQLDREQRLSQGLRELGFKRRGRKIAERLTRAIDIAQDQADKEDS